MREIIFWFSDNKRKNYWLNYAFNHCKRYTVNVKCNKVESYIIFLNLKISFKVNTNDTTDLAGRWHIKQYWVEDLFDNNFEEFFFTFIFDNEPFK